MVIAKKLGAHKVTLTLDGGIMAVLTCYEAASLAARLLALTKGYLRAESAKRTKQIKDLADAGHSGVEIARRVGVIPTYVSKVLRGTRGRRKSAGPFRWTDDRIDKLRRLADDGLIRSEIEDQFIAWYPELNQTNVENAIRRFGIKTVPGKPGPRPNSKRRRPAEASLPP